MSKNDTKLFNDVYEEISEELGIDIALKMHSIYKGQQISFPTHLYCPKKIKSVVVKEYDGTNLKALAKKYDYSEKTIRRIVKDSK